MSNLTDRIGDVKPERFYVLRFCFGGGRDILVCLMRSGYSSEILARPTPDVGHDAAASFDPNVARMSAQSIKLLQRV